MMKNHHQQLLTGRQHCLLFFIIGITISRISAFHHQAPAGRRELVGRNSAELESGSNNGSLQSLKGEGGGGGDDPGVDEKELESGSSSNGSLLVRGTMQQDEKSVVDGTSGDGSADGGDTDANDDDDEKEVDTLQVRDFESILEIVVPLAAPVIAFLTYEYLAQAFSSFIDIFSNVNWIPVDGGSYQAKVIAPAVNGVIVPATSLLYATLASTTISTLRQRQLDMRKSINLEAAELRNLSLLLQAYPRGNVRDVCKTYFVKYTNRVVSECEPHVVTGEDVLDPRRGMETELNGFLMQIYRAQGESIPSHLAEQSLSSIMRLREHRLLRVTALQSTYPLLHYGILAILALSECTAFLMETNQDVLFFLSAFQLKALWSILVGTYFACFTVIYDLQSPFTGSYQISTAVDQIHRIRNSVAAKSFDK